MPGDRHPGGEHEAEHAEQLQAHPAQRREPAVEHVEPVPGGPDALGADGDALLRGGLETVRARDRHEGGHLADAGGEVLDLAAERLVALAGPSRQDEPQQHGERDGQRVDGQELGDGQRGHDDRAEHHHRRGQQRVGDLLEHHLDVLDVAHDLGLHDRRADARVEADGEALQPRGEPVAQVGADLADRAHEELGPLHVVRVVLHERGDGDRGPEPQLARRAAGDDDVDDLARDHRHEPERDVLHGEERDCREHALAVGAEEAEHRADGVGAVDVDHGEVRVGAVCHGFHRDIRGGGGIAPSRARTYRFDERRSPGRAWTAG